MKGMIFKKALLLSGIFLLSTFMLVQLSWGCDDDDKWDRDCHDKWHWDHHGKPCHPPKIEIVYLNSDGNSIYFTILGKNFDNGVRPVVTLGGFYDLTVGPYSDDQIEATLPLPKLPDQFEYGDYRLIVSTCHDSACKYCEDYCSKCKDKHCRDYCSKCRDRYCKSKYCKDDEHKCRCKDRYSLTIPNPAGPQGVIGWEIRSVQGTLVIGTNQMSGMAPCSSGFKVTGGGFSRSASVTITASTPFQNPKNPNETGWQVISTVEKEFPEPELTIYAVCVQSQQVP